jgi:hypothetical protein
MNLYSWDELRAHVEHIDVSPRSKSTYKVGDLIIDARRGFNPERLEWFLDLDPKHRATWERRRKDFKDTSLSTYDASLSSLAVGCGFTDQEIVDLLVAHRVKHGNPLKGIAAYKDCISTAREWRAPIAGGSNGVVAVLDEISDDARKIEQEEALTALRELCNAPTLKIWRMDADDPYFVVEIDRRKPIGASKRGAEDLTYRSFRSAVINASYSPYVGLDKGHAKTFTDTVEPLIRKAAVDKSSGPETIRGNETVDWLRRYLDDRPPEQYIPGESHSRAELVMQRPIRIDEQTVWFWSSNLYDWLGEHHYRNVTTPDLSDRLGEIGAVSASKNSSSLRPKDGKIVQSRPRIVPAYVLRDEGE